MFQFFLNPPYEKTEKQKWGNVNSEEIKKLLCEEHDFSEERINNLLKKFNENKEQRKQKGLGEFTKYSI